MIDRIIDDTPPRASTSTPAATSDEMACRSAAGRGRGRGRGRRDDRVVHGTATHVHVSITHDGGLSRVRIYGRPRWRTSMPPRGRSGKLGVPYIIELFLRGSVFIIIRSLVAALTTAPPCRTSSLYIPSNDFFPLALVL